MTRKEKEEERFKQLVLMERQLEYEGLKYIAGVDEVGRGPLAGPVLACCVVLPRDFYELGIDDSKRLSEKRRQFLSEIIRKEALAFGIGRVEPEQIDEINILRATKRAMTDAINACDIMLQERGGAIEYLLIDGMSLENLGIPQDSVIKGDSTCLSIAAASIVAKVERDRMMEAYHIIYPGYGFDRNKGYGTKEHCNCLLEKGPCPVHRRSFIKKIGSRNY
ncbi:MAG: ribonuclease HII [Anaerovoracaceae bacterium]|nr:ribonuclease HII [Clostridiales bacterium]